MRKNKWILAALLVLTAVIVSGCTLFGSTTPGTSERQQAEHDVRTVFSDLSQAGVNQDLDTIRNHLLGSVMLHIESDDEDGFSHQIQGDAGVVASLQNAWANGEVTEVDIQVAEVNASGGQAEVIGTFEVAYTDEYGRALECVGYAIVRMEQHDGVWKIAEVIVEEAACLVDGEQPVDEPGSVGSGADDFDEETADPVDEEDHDGVLTEEEMLELLAQPPNIAFATCEYLVTGANGSQPRAVQTALTYLGYKPGLIDGDYGQLTTAAVKAFQRDQGLVVDGEFGPITQAAMHRELARRGGSYQCGSSDNTPPAPGTGRTKLTVTSLRTGTAFETPVYTYEAAVSGPTIVFVGGIHGNEQSGYRTLVDIINRGIEIDRGKLVIVPAINRIAVEQNRRTLSRSGSLLSGKDFNRFFPVGKTPTYTIAKEMWNILSRDRNLAFVVDFHDGFINSLGNTLIHTQQTKARTVATRIRDSLNRIRPSNATGPRWRAFTEPISGSLIRKVGRDLKVPGILVELSGRTVGDPLSLRKRYAEEIIRMVGSENGMTIRF